MGKWWHDLSWFTKLVQPLEKYGDCALKAPFGRMPVLSFVLVNVMRKTDFRWDKTILNLFSVKFYLNTN